MEPAVALNTISQQRSFALLPFKVDNKIVVHRITSISLLNYPIDNYSITLQPYITLLLHTYRVSLLPTAISFLWNSYSQLLEAQSYFLVRNGQTMCRTSSN